MDLAGATIAAMMTTTTPMKTMTPTIYSTTVTTTDVHLAPERAGSTKPGAHRINKANRSAPDNKAVCSPSAAHIEGTRQL